MDGVSDFWLNLVSVAPAYCFTFGSLLNLDYQIVNFLQIEKTVCEFNKQNLDYRKIKRKIKIVHVLCFLLLMLNTLYFIIFWGNGGTKE